MHLSHLLEPTQVQWHASLDAVPASAPSIYIAHEFLDALPVHQFVRDARRGWLEVCGARELGWERGGGGSLYPCTGWLEVLKGQWVGEMGWGNQPAGG
jgi:hypothetical protein